jgi:hypothetical protein
MSDKWVSRRRLLTSATIAGTGALAGCLGYLPVDKGIPNNDGTSTIHIAPEGSPLNSGSEDDPLGSIDRATDFADPGDTVYVHPGTYIESVQIHNGGTADEPITLTGPPEAILKPPDGSDSACVEINSSYIHLTGLTINGLHNPDEPRNPESYHPDKLISINSEADGPDAYLEGLVVSPHRIGNAGQSLINSVQFKDSEVGGFEVIGPAGTKWIFDDDEGHNGEIVYLGTAPDNRLDRGYETYDRTRNIRVHHIDNTAGYPHSELVDCKAGVENITIEYCTDGGGVQSNDSYYSRAISMDAHNCTIRWNIINGPDGDCVRIGPQGYLSDINWVDSEPQTQFERKLGTGHSIYGNVFTGYTHEALNFLRESKRPGRDTNPRPEDQRVICNNLYDGYSDADLSMTCPSGVPSESGVGRLGGDSPWNSTAPTMREAFDQRALGTNLETTVETQSSTADAGINVSITSTNTGNTIKEVTFELRGRSHLLESSMVEITPGETRNIDFVLSLPDSVEVAVTRNGQKIGSVRANP